MTSEYYELLNWLEDCAGVSNDVICFACDTMGDNLKTLETVLYWAEGLRNLEQVKEDYPEGFM